MTESALSRWLFDLLKLAFVLFIFAMGSAMAYGFWQWVLSPSIPRCF